MILLVIPVLIIITAVLAIKYFKTAKKVLNETDYEKEVIRSADRTIKKDHFITCDYCGAVVDTSKEKVCPVCGGAYDKDDEWIALRTVDEEIAREEAKKYKERVRKNIRKQTNDTVRKLKLCLMIWSGIAAIIILAVVIWNYSESGYRSRYAKDDDPKKALAYMKAADCTIAGDGVIVDESGIRVTITGLYQHITDPYTYKAGIRYENNSDTDAKIAIYCLGANGCLTTEQCIIGYEMVKKGSSVTKYEALFYKSFAESCGIENIGSLYFGKIHASDPDYDYIFEKDGIVTIKTDVTQTEPKIPQGELLYDENGIQIIREKSYRAYDEAAIDHVLWITNNGQFEYVLDSDMYFKNESLSFSGLYETSLPAGMLLRCELSGSGEAYKNALPTDEAKAVITFDCKEDPSQSFKTGYLSLKMEADD